MSFYPFLCCESIVTHIANVTITPPLSGTLDLMKIASQY